MNVGDLKFEPCAKCGGVNFNFRNQRTIFYLADVIKIRCNNCGDVVTIPKSGSSALNRAVPLVSTTEAVHQRQ